MTHPLHLNIFTSDSKNEDWNSQNATCGFKTIGHKPQGDVNVVTSTSETG